MVGARFRVARSSKGVNYAATQSFLPTVPRGSHQPGSSRLERIVRDHVALQLPNFTIDDAEMQMITAPMKNGA